MSMSGGVHLSARGIDASSAHESIELLKTPSPTAATATATGGLKAQAAPPHKARWMTPEFLVYIGFLAFCFWKGIGLVWEASNSTWRPLTLPHCRCSRAINSCRRCALKVLRVGRAR